MTPNPDDRFQRWNLDSSNNQQLNKNQQQEAHTAAAESGERRRFQIGGEEGEQENDAALAALQRVRVNLTRRELGLHAGRGSRLIATELLAWAHWVANSHARGIKNKAAFAAAKIRMGCTLDDVFPEAIRGNAGGRNALQGLPPDLRDLLFETLRNGSTIDSRWLSEHGISLEAVTLARQHIGTHPAAEVSATPFCDALSTSDPVEYRVRLERILDTLEIPKFANSRRSIDHPMCLGMCRARLERELATKHAG
jgi:hypothetical protein